MTEKEITLELFNPLDFFGVNNANIEFLRRHFPKLKIIARDHTLKLIGDDEAILDFEKLLNEMLKFVENHTVLTVEDISRLLHTGEDSSNAAASQMPDSDILLPGRQGNMIRAKTPNQRKMVESCKTNDLLFAIGPAGTGKTYTAVALAVRALKNKEVKRIILTRPAVEAGENLGFLPGDLKDKLDPYLQPLYDALWDMIPAQKLSSYIEDGVIEIAPLAFMRGRTLDHAFAILDEGQNATVNQMKMFLTRMGKSAKFVVTGDITQIDLPGRQVSGLVHAAKLLNDIKGIDFVYLNNQDIIRHKLIVDIINAYSKSENEKI